MVTAPLVGGYSGWALYFQGMDAVNGRWEGWGVVYRGGWTLERRSQSYGGWLQWMGAVFLGHACYKSCI